MGTVNAVIEVGKHKLDVALGSNGEVFSELNQPHAITRLAKRLAGHEPRSVLVGVLPFRRRRLCQMSSTSRALTW